MSSTLISAALTVSLFVLVVKVKGEFTSGTVYVKDGKPTFVAGKLDKNGAAYGTYNNTLLVNGWGVLEINTGKQLVTPDQRMLAAGFIEGTLTASQMWAHYQNVAPFFLKGKDPSVIGKLKRFFFQQDTWMRGMISKYAKMDPFWAHAGYILSQYDGLYAGYKAAGKPEWDLDEFVVQVLNGAGDLLDLMHVVNPAGRPDFTKMSHTEFRQFVLENSHCSALVKVLGAYENIYMSHSSWFTYSATSRIFKYYNFDLGDPNTSATKIAFSSYPGFLESLDDFYMMGNQMVVLQTTNNVFNLSLYDSVDSNSLLAWHRIRIANMLAGNGQDWAKSFSRYNSGTLESQDDFYLLSSQLVVLQTTNNVFNTSLYETVRPQSLLSWHRMRVADMLAETGAEWAKRFSRYNSGTYNNQYMVVDLKRIKLRENIGDGALWVVEQIPTLVEGSDQSALLRAGYWPSYNVPFYEAVYNKSGYPDVVRRYGLTDSYQLAPRAKIFRRDQDNVHDMKTMQKIMRYNDYRHDPYSADQPCNTICCRGDLNEENPSPMGCYDTKVTDFAMAQKLQAYVINGPTLGTDLKPFSWTGQFEKFPHVGLPKSYNFPWVYMKPSL